MNKHFPIFQRTLFTVFLILSISDLKGQAYIPFPMSNVSWRILSDYTYPLVCSEQYTIDYSFLGDTNVNNNSYRIITTSNEMLFRHNNGFIGCSPFSNYFMQYGLRQDTLGKKVFIFDFSSNQEYLLYDFNLNIGDTLFNSFLLPQGSACSYAKVQNIDSILINNVFHKHWTFDCIQDVIEGIGSMYDPFGTSTDGLYLMCFHDSLNNFIFYNTVNNFHDSASVYTSCSFLNQIMPFELVGQDVTIEYMSENQFGMIKFENFNTSCHEYEMHVYNLYGLEQFKRSISEGNSNHINIKINFHDLSTGIYILRLVNICNGLEASRKILIK